MKRRPLVTGLSAPTGILERVPSDPIGLIEVAKMLGVSKMTAARYTNRPDFPKPIVIARGRIWSQRQVERWAEKTLPLQPGRPRKTK